MAVVDPSTPAKSDGDTAADISSTHEDSVHNESSTRGADTTHDESHISDGEGDDHADGSRRASLEPYFAPAVFPMPPEVTVASGEDDEDVMFVERARLYRFEANADGGSEWKERGTGEIKLLKHKEKGSVRVLMRRDQTLKPCANHLVQHWMELRPNCGSDRAFVWNVHADFADGEPSSEVLAIRFGKPEYAKKFSETFSEAVKIATDLHEKKSSDDNKDGDEKTDDSKELADKLDKVEISK